MVNNRYENGLFIFRRDLRIIDNTSLNLLNKVCNNIYTIFIFTPEQVSSTNKYKSNNTIQFMIESIINLSSDIKKDGGYLYTFFGDNDKIISNCIKKFNINVVGFNLDISPYARNRDKEIMNLCANKVDILTDYDYYLHNPETIFNKSGKPYQKFTPFYNTARKLSVKKSSKKIKLNVSKNDAYIKNTITLNDAMRRFTKINKDILIHGGRNNALLQLKKSSNNIKNYIVTHNDLTKSTSLLSAYIKYGCISIREVYELFKKNKMFVRQLYWRDFYANLLYSYPTILTHSLKEKYNKIKWHNNKMLFKAWCEARTGYPIIDACMRQLNKTGYIHNRGRLIVASFLVKILLIDWKKGEQYFSTKLIDYDIANNNLNWQWIASVSVDSQPYFRIFNPWIQSIKYDKNCEFIKQYIPELKNVPSYDIHNWNIKYKEHKNIKYPKPIVNYSIQKIKALKMYKNIFK